MAELSQQECDILIALEKILEKTIISFPLPGKSSKLKINDTDGKEKLLLYIVPGSKSSTKCSYTQTYNKSTVILRLDTEQQIHFNPDGSEVPAPHLHIYKEGYDDKFAYPLPKGFTDSKDLIKTLYDLLSYSNIININDIRITLQGGLFNEKSATS